MTYRNLKNIIKFHKAFGVREKPNPFLSIVLFVSNKLRNLDINCNSETITWNKFLCTHITIRKTGESWNWSTFKNLRL